MLSIERKLISYKCINTGRDIRHHVLIADIGKKYVLLSQPNLFLYEHAKSSKETSNRYSSVISMFYRYISGESKFANIDISKYHVIADNNDIKTWQVSRQVARVKAQKDSPSSETIFEDAKILLFFFKWISDSGYITNVKVKMRTWVANFKSTHMLNYVRKKATESIDVKNIEVLDKECRQKSLKTLITNCEIKILLKSFKDPVYASMFKLALGTAMRPMDLCKFPYIGNGTNKHIMPYSDMRHNDSTVDYFVSNSKGNKSRVIKINLLDLKALEDNYIRIYYASRVKKYQQRFGVKCPPHILFLNEQGRPVTPSMITSRTNDAKNKAMHDYPEFRESVVFYDARHWWPTMFLLKFFKDKLLSQSADALYAAAGAVLINQMGHNDISTTYKFYVDMARLTLMAHEGCVNELITEPDESTMGFIERIDGDNNG